MYPTYCESARRDLEHRPEHSCSLLCSHNEEWALTIFHWTHHHKSQLTVCPLKTQRESRGHSGGPMHQTALFQECAVNSRAHTHQDLCKGPRWAPSSSSVSSLLSDTTQHQNNGVKICWWDILFEDVFGCSAATVHCALWAVKLEIYWAQIHKNQSCAEVVLCLHNGSVWSIN